MPVTVSVEAATGVFEAVVTVNVDGVPALIDVGLKDAVAPEGNPLTASPTFPVNEPTAPTLTV